MLSDQNAIATINQQAIERDVLHCRVMIARTPGEVNAISQEIDPVLIINNSQNASFLRHEVFITRISREKTGIPSPGKFVTDW
ncbi:hypothetical protein P296_12045 [Salmonella enterica subsp. arizonae serovar 18:z4,z23:- str. CVM N26624]|uniref:Uncharacterized protein n=2 Tax=Salmonella enterica subsp. arizonae TaxID=59203 RepID=A9MI81_SALAR|nr:hypothetical protein SARI_03615 [Salmonella enterica subsp. arizonae serovar 62:z4,z23:-]AIP97979.1 hypothetical protein N898_16910 [Salmonella enterica subsp. arizonae serovar 62:z36:- str. RKS2983]OLV92539.1 hypothetical protein P298_04090 [Salmonella enterica subsp. arizonae serovar 18:z4,z23:- str. CVM N26626]OLV97042.1 hypothetical protein P297_17680 [Salmonella enterica subsp. arizonae serovar 18:z4,z23:- str. CVM N26625]OLW01795.1 hypothetical protein P296_12045 [Salmonella enterica s